MFLLDTNALIYAFKGQGRYRERIDAIDPKLLQISSLSLFEIEFGLARSTRPAPLRLFIEDARRRHALLPLDAQSAVHAGRLRQALHQKGTPIGPYDLLIAGSGLAHNLIVVTRNIREFARVPGLRVEDWYD
jgi:tRNA(fMet)-specific endonuclease VapC